MRNILGLCLILCTGPALADTLAGPAKVLTDMPVVQSLVAQVMGTSGAPGLLLEQGADVHSFQLRPSQAAAIVGADLLFWVGPELTPWLERAVHGSGLTGRSVELLHAPGTETRRYDQEDAPGRDAKAHADHADDPDGTAGDADDHDHIGTDPHAWLDPANARAWVTVIAQELAAADPANAAIYLANASAARSAIDALEAEVKATLAPVGDAPIAVHHDAYGYFSGHFGVNIIGEIEQGDASAPSAGKLADLRGTIAASGAVCLFPEAQQDSGLIAAVAEGIDIRTGGALDPEGTTLPGGPGLYAALMRGLAETIAACVAG